MNKYSIVRKTDWDAFVATTDPNILSFWKRESGRFPNFLLVCLSETTWRLAKATGKFITIPAPWVSVKRLPANLQAVIGPIALDADTVGDVMEDLVGKDLFRE